jgi:hypothetical protein
MNKDDCDCNQWVQKILGKHIQRLSHLIDVKYVNPHFFKELLKFYRTATFKLGHLYAEAGAVVSAILPTMRRLAAFGTEVKLRLEDDVCELDVDNGDVTVEDIKE